MARAGILPSWVIRSTTTQQAVPYRKALRRPTNPTRDYMPLVLAVLTTALGALLLVGAAVGSGSSFIPLVGVLLIVLGGVIFYYWRYE